MRIAVLGAGSWGTTVASLLAGRHDCTVWARDPELAREIDERDEVPTTRKPLRLEPAHLTRRSRTALSRFAADNPAHRRIMT